MKMKYQDNKGFSLIELIVAGSIFIGVLAFVGGTFSLFVAKQRKQISQQLLQQEVQNFLDVFDREVRTAYGETFEFNSATASFEFYNQEQKGVTSPAKSSYGLPPGGRIIYTGPNKGWIYLTSDKIEIKEINFVLNKPTEDVAGKYLSTSALRVTVMLNVCVRGDASSCIRVQNTTTSRQTRPIDAP